MDSSREESERRAAFAAARAACRREGGSFHLASFFLPRPKRDGVYAVWAFARLIQQATTTDSAGGGSGECCSGGGAAIAGLLKARIDAMYAAAAQLPLPQFRDESEWTLLAAGETVRRFEIPRHLWHDLIDGLVAMNHLQRVATWRSLDAHLAATAGVAARIVSAVLGATHSEAGDFAAAIGRAVALTSILHHLKRDLARGRLFLPLDDFARARYSERELAGGVVNDAFCTLINVEIDRARELLQRGASGTCWLAGDGSRMAAAALASMQNAALDDIERNVDELLQDPADRGRKKRPSLASQLRSLPLAWKIAKRRAAEEMPSLRADHARH